MFFFFFFSKVRGARSALAGLGLVGGFAPSPKHTSGAEGRDPRSGSPRTRRSLLLQKSASYPNFTVKFAEVGFRITPTSVRTSVRGSLQKNFCEAKFLNVEEK